MKSNKLTNEEKRLEENLVNTKDWYKWGPYLSERQWGTVREDYSPGGDAWNYFSHDSSRSRTYRWGEDGIAGISDKYCNICFGVALWNGKDSILKERLFGLTGPQGNHGEDVKELYYYLENTPTHSYMKHLYKYPQNEFPYKDLVEENSRRGKQDLEYEILDTGIFDNNEYFDVYTEYAKADEQDLLIKITVSNRSDKPAPLYLLPTLWIRNFWSFVGMPEKPSIKKEVKNGVPYVSVDHIYVGKYNMYFEEPSQLLFTENETNMEKLYLQPNDHPYKKDFFHDTVIKGDYSKAKLKQEGTKFAPMYKMQLKAGETKTVKLRLTNGSLENPFDEGFDTVFAERVKESQEFLEATFPDSDKESLEIQRQAIAGLLWSKQYYNYEVEKWLEGDFKEFPPSPSRYHGRNNQWETLRIHDILSMPDKWEYPWFAAWDTAFHCVSIALVDANFAKEQLLLFTKEWYMSPSGQIPAYEWNFSDVNPPVQAWASLQVFQLEKKKTGKGDIRFLKRMFNKLALNFTWWVNRVDREEKNVFEGGFLGLDNIGVFDRSNGVPGGGILEQVDGTSWMALYCLNMLEMALEISLEDDSFEDMAMKYFGHFVFIAEALNTLKEGYKGSWDQHDGFFYDNLILPNGESFQIKVRSISGLLSLAAVLNIKKEYLEKLPRFRKSMQWFRTHRIQTAKYRVMEEFNEGEDVLLSLVPKARLNILMSSMLSEKEFLSPHGIRSLSKVHEKPYNINIAGTNYCINYEPAESSTRLFGGNSNWRGPIWMPMNYLFLDSLREYHSYFGDSLTFNFPTGKEDKMNLRDISDEIGTRLTQLFKTDAKGNRPIHKLHEKHYKDPHFKDLVLFYEYFHGDNGRGAGASHQTGWTALVANLLADIE
ncbi:MGH1-like glycoside hydrolase domain-containing protein [Arenibacter latericius]|uniref:MGH1-like glycoside hydrolase domain-containing protein n=1 Tax=Arenibacter latericius TaxID=86104 RepID=UPI00040EF9D8|nr:glucosidase [Arenibacter latericius]MDX1363531.1 glucosidase [Arenibacter latericius]